jgi:hypothetical protein
MNQKDDVYTETMAKVYADQGHWAKAADIYRHLVSKEPERQELMEALVEAEIKMNDISQKIPEKLVRLFREWIGLVLQHEKLQRLKRMKSKL